MNRIYVLLLILGASMAGCCSGSGAAASGEQTSKIKKDAPGTKDASLRQARCPVMGGEVNRTIQTEYKGAKLYFCCPPCIEKFKTDKAKYAIKANEQLVVTGQAKQATCPISGCAINANGKTFVVDGIKVLVGCGCCLKELEGLSDAEQRERVFGDTTFAKAFVIKGNGK